MVIYRLKRWLSRLRSSLVASLRSDPDTRYTSPYSGHAMASTSGRGNAHGAGASGTATSWLDDSRRMRPLMRPRSTPSRRSPETPAHPSISRASRDEESQQTPPAMQIPLAPHGEEAGRTITPIGTPAPQGKAGSADTPGADQRVSPYGGISDRLMRQRLMALRRLVRMGVYNEGFDARKLPAQYFYSAGRDANGNPLDE